MNHQVEKRKKRKPNNDNPFENGNISNMISWTDKDIRGIWSNEIKVNES